MFAVQAASESGSGEQGGLEEGRVGIGDVELDLARRVEDYEGNHSRGDEGGEHLHGGVLAEEFGRDVLGGTIDGKERDGDGAGAVGPAGHAEDGIALASVARRGDEDVGLQVNLELDEDEDGLRGWGRGRCG